MPIQSSAWNQATWGGLPWAGHEGSSGVTVNAIFKGVASALIAPKITATFLWVNQNSFSPKVTSTFDWINKAQIGSPKITATFLGVDSATVTFIPHASAVFKWFTSTFSPVLVNAVFQFLDLVNSTVYGGPYDIPSVSVLKYQAWPQVNMPICFIEVKPQYSVIPANPSTQVESNMASASENDPQFGQS